jgi:GNAT superfamily N-acetyltransferase
MNIEVINVPLSEIASLRELYLAENNFLIRYHARHERGWSDSWLLMVNNKKVGYGSVMGKEELTHRDTIFEFYIDPAYRNKTSEIFKAFLKSTGAAYIECQTNEKILTALLFEFATNIESDTFLFKDSEKTALNLNRVNFRMREKQDTIFHHKLEPEGNFVLDQNGSVVATGGFMLHYNKPFADLYMEVDEPYRKMGYGSFLIQELKKECYLAGRVPAARCNKSNVASRNTLQKAGFVVSGFMASGVVKK